MMISNRLYERNSQYATYRKFVSELYSIIIGHNGQMICPPLYLNPKPEIDPNLTWTYQNFSSWKTESIVGFGGLLNPIFWVLLKL